MSGTFFDYMHGRIDARFSHAQDNDCIVLRIRMYGAVVKTTDCDNQFRLGRSVNHAAPCLRFTVYMTSVWCPFKDFIRFIEAISIQVKECGFEWDPEGPDGKMEWRRGYVNDTGFLTVSWHSRRQKFSHVMTLNTRQAVRMLYTAFRRFVESPEYDPIRYEKMTTGEAFKYVLVDTADSTLEKVAEAFADMDWESAGKLLHVLLESFFRRALGGPCLRHSLNHYVNEASQFVDEYQVLNSNRLFKEWNEFDKSQRITEIVDELFPSNLASCWYGANLRSLRSPLIEEYLARPE